MAKKTWETEAFIRAWLKHTDKKTWDEFYAGMKKEAEAASPKISIPTENAVNLRCQKINKAVKKAFKKTYPVPAKPKAAKNIAELLKMNPDLMPS